MFQWLAGCWLVQSGLFVRSLVDARNFLVVVGIIINVEKERDGERDERRNKKKIATVAKRGRKMRMNHLVDEERGDACERMKERNEANERKIK